MGSALNNRIETYKAVKEPWRRSNRFDALSQMLLTNQRLTIGCITDRLCSPRDVAKGPFVIYP